MLVNIALWSWYSLAAQRWLAGFSQLEITALTILPGGIALCAVAAALVARRIGGGADAARCGHRAAGALHRGRAHRPGQPDVAQRRRPLGLPTMAMFANLTPVVAILLAVVLGADLTWRAGRGRACRAGRRDLCAGAHGPRERGVSHRKETRVTQIERLFARNRAWAARRIAADPDCFRRLSEAQRPSVLWIGCSDSRVPAEDDHGLRAGRALRPPQCRQPAGPVGRKRPRRPALCGRGAGRAPYRGVRPRELRRGACRPGRAGAGASASLAGSAARAGGAPSRRTGRAGGGGAGSRGCASSTSSSRRAGWPPCRCCARPGRRAGRRTFTASSTTSATACCARCAR